MHKKVSEKEQYQEEKRQAVIEQKKQLRKEQGIKLKMFRLSKGFSQLELATELGVTQSTITQVESGVRAASSTLRDLLYTKYQFDLKTASTLDIAHHIPISRNDYSLNKKLKRIRLDLELSRVDFAHRAGLGLSTVSNLENNTRPVSPVVAHRIKEAFDIDIYTYDEEREYPKDVLSIPFYTPHSAEKTDSLFFDDRWFRNILGINPDNLKLIIAKDDTMDTGLNPLTDIKEGDLLLIDTFQTEGNGKVYAILLDSQDVVIRKLTKHLDGSIELTTLNPKYEPITYQKERPFRVRVIGKVVLNGSKTYN